MNIFGNSAGYAGAASNILSLLFGRKPANAGQTAPTGNDGAATASQASPLAPASTAGGQFAPTTLGSLLSVQQQTFQPPTAGDLAAKLIKQADRNGDGQLNLSEVASALGGQGSSAGAAQAAFSKLDADGDGQLSASELTAAINSFRQAHGRGGSNAAPAPSQVSATA